MFQTTNQPINRRFLLLHALSPVKQFVPCLIHPSPKIPAIHKIAVEEETILFLGVLMERSKVGFARLVIQWVEIVFLRYDQREKPAVKICCFVMGTVYLTRRHGE